MKYLICEISDWNALELTQEILFKAANGIAIGYDLNNAIAHLYYLWIFSFELFDCGRVDYSISVDIVLEYFIPWPLHIVTQIHRETTKYSRNRHVVGKPIQLLITKTLRFSHESQHNVADAKRLPYLPTLFKDSVPDKGFLMTAKEKEFFFLFLRIWQIPIFNQSSFWIRRRFTFDYLYFAFFIWIVMNFLTLLTTFFCYIVGKNVFDFR